ncbi:hypothetical protein SAMN06266787_11525 [Halorubrum ezzemoulense]|uniref:Uncharacterized protein n=2 Tax=Halorubrum ezzemoulense TaxID=337243 RepID=A0A238YNM7_HALEZ|nr:hypothetical protein SAMN06266787_11525 [Halorubrum ezzemoulense]
MTGSSIQMKFDETETTQRTVLSVTIAASVALGVTLLVWMLLEQPFSGEHLIRNLFILTKVFVSIFTATILLGVGVTYFRIYLCLPNQFTRTLLLINVSLLLYAIWANPIVWVVFGVEPTGIGLFTVLPDIFTALAAVMLLQQSGM